MLDQVKKCIKDIMTISAHMQSKRSLDINRIAVNALTILETVQSSRYKIKELSNGNFGLFRSRRVWKLIDESVGRARLEGKIPRLEALDAGFVPPAPIVVDSDEIKHTGTVIVNEGE